MIIVFGLRKDFKNIYVAIGVHAEEVLLIQRIFTMYVENEILIETLSFATVFLCYFREVIVHKKAREIL